MKLGKLFAITRLAPWRRIRSVNKTQVIKRTPFKINPRRKKSTDIVKTASDRSAVESTTEMVTNTQSSHCSLQDLIQLAARELLESRQVHTDCEEVYEEMNFHVMNDTDNEYMDMNFKRL